MDFPTSIQIPPVPDNSFFEDTDGGLHNEGTITGKLAQVNLGVYDNLTWSDTSGMSDDTIIDWGTKTLPGAGAFYFANHEDGYPTMGHMNQAQPDD